MYTPFLSNGLTPINPSDDGSFIAKCSHLSPACRTGAPHMGSAWFLPPPPSHTTEQTPVPMINILRLVRCVPSLCLSASLPSPPPPHIHHPPLPTSFCFYPRRRFLPSGSHSPCSRQLCPLPHPSSPDKAWLCVYVDNCWEMFTWLCVYCMTFCNWSCRMNRRLKFSL